MHGSSITSPATSTSTLTRPLLLALPMQVGSADAVIRIFQQEEMMDSLQEADEVVALCSLGGSRWGYALANGTIGLYEGTRRVWRYKSKHVPVCCAAFDLDGDGQVEMISGWSSGKVGACCWRVASAAVLALGQLVPAVCYKPSWHMKAMLGLCSSRATCRRRGIQG
jgi:hypothetical protein